ncbi:peptidoglycan DD-metalloendopeptidase family protein [Microbacterium pumilum]|uniref:peptidoglycan DD-metalloendopeptidase family protein n=1 Tax=Microbacterium pumilum TaxID=344165 RepID=UPI0031D92222
MVWGRSVPVATETDAAAPSAAEFVATAVAAAAVSIPVDSVVPSPVNADTSTPAGSPISRRARRVTQTGEQSAIVVSPLVDDESAKLAGLTASVHLADLTASAQPEAASSLPDAVLTPAEPFELLEPALVTGPIAFDEPIAESVDDEPLLGNGPSASVDEFEAAARLFSFTGETPIQASAQAQPDAPHSDARPAHWRPRHRPDASTAPRVSNPRSGTAFKRLTAASFSIGVMGIVGLLTVGMTTPAEAVAVANGVDITSTVLAPGDTDIEIDPDEIQAYVAPATVEDAELVRTENYSTVTLAELAHESGIQNFSNFFVNDPNSAIQWPFAVGVPISYGFGMRSGRMHEGVDFTPGAGSPIQAIADGVVREATSSGGAYGVSVIIDHQIDGQLVSSHYAHMQYGSLQVSVGQHVTVGTVIGRTGNTGRSYGAHTHFEILMNGTTPIDPIPWMRAHAGG